MRRRISALAIISGILVLTLAAAVAVIVSAPSRASTSAATQTATPAPAAAGASPSPRRGYLGVQVAPVDAVAQQRYNLARNYGAVVVSVEPGSPAQRAGLKTGDLIVGVDGKGVTSVSGLTAALSSHGPGDRVSLDLFSGPQQRTVQVSLGPAPAAEAAPAPPAIASLPPALLAPILGMLGGSPTSFVSADYSVKDASGNTITTHFIGGTVKAATSKTVTITPNGGGADKQYTVSSATVISAGIGRSNALNLTTGQHILVVTQGSSSTAAEIVVLDALGAGLPAIPAPSPGRFPVPSFPPLPATPTPARSTQ
jgi:membrane-associated protease RseP (regulator of RpoE activity)